MKKPRVVITGIGVVSALGIGKDEFWKNCFAGVSGIKPLTLFDTSNLNVKVGGEIADLDVKAILGDDRLMDLDRATILLLCASQLALSDSGLKVTDANTYQTGVSVGTTFGSLHSISRYDRESVNEGPRFSNPSVFPSTVGNSPASRVSIKFKIKGFNTTISTGMSAGLDALVYARDFITLGRVQQVLGGAVEDLSQQVFLGFYKLKYLSGIAGLLPVSRPFDVERDGIVCGEGATVLVLEEYEAAKAAGRKMYGEILGIGSTYDATRFYRHNPKGTGMQKSMHQALADAKLKPEDIDCVFANANSTRDADAIESLSIKEVFGAYGSEVPVTAIKSMAGETMSNSGTLSVAAALGAMAKGRIPPVINTVKVDKKCGVNAVLGQAAQMRVSTVLVNAFGTNGTNTSIIIGKSPS